MAKHVFREDQIAFIGTHTRAEMVVALIGSAEFLAAQFGPRAYGRHRTKAQAPIRHE